MSKTKNTRSADEEDSEDGTAPTYASGETHQTQQTQRAQNTSSNSNSNNSNSSSNIPNPDSKPKAKPDMNFSKLRSGMNFFTDAINGTPPSSSSSVPATAAASSLPPPPPPSSTTSSPYSLNTNANTNTNRTPRSRTKQPHNNNNNTSTSPEALTLKIVSSSTSPTRGKAKAGKGGTLTTTAAVTTKVHGKTGTTISPTRVSTLQNLSLPLPSPNPAGHGVGVGVGGAAGHGHGGGAHGHGHGHGHGGILPAESDLDIEEGTPAAEALRANADVKVTKFVKVARSLHVNAVRRVLKKSVGAGMGVKRGKPPRLPNLVGSDDGVQVQNIDGGAGAGDDEQDEHDLNHSEKQQQQQQQEIMKSSGPGIQLDILQESDEEYMDDDDDDNNDDDEFNNRMNNTMEDTASKVINSDSHPSFHEPDSMGIGIFSKSSEDESLGMMPSTSENEKESSTSVTAATATAGGSASGSGSGSGGRRKRQDSFTTQQSLTLLDTKGKKREVKLIRRNEKKKEKKLKRLEKKKARNYVKGKVIDGEHELYTLSIAMMLGLRYSIFLTNNQLKEDKKNGRFWLDSDEFMKVEKYSFRPDGRNNTPPHKLSHTFKFKDYSPLPFAFIRRMFGINEYEFHHSVCGNANFIEFISNAKSGQFFFYSSDGKYMIKTMTNAESKFLRRILPHYFQHCSQNPNTILTRFLGMYRVKLYHLRRNVKFVIMNSVFDTDKMLSSFYDLKGSVLGRDAKPGESVQKDNDLRRDIPASTIRLQPKVRERLREQVRRDCEFLKNMEIMDYSMLVGIHYIPTKNSDPSEAPIRGRVFRGSKPSYKLERARSDSAAIMNMSKAPPSSLSSSVRSPSIFERLGFDKKQQQQQQQDQPNRSRSDVFHVTKGSPTDENFSESQKRVEFTLNNNNRFDLHVSQSDDKIRAETPPSSATCFPSFRNPCSGGLSPTDTSFDGVVGSSGGGVSGAGTGAGIGGEKPADVQSAVSGSTLGIDIDDEASLLDVSNNKRSFLEDKSRLREDWMVEHAKIEQRRELAIEQNYWPFHRHFELNGDRRIVPMNASQLVVEDARIAVETGGTCNCYGEVDDGGDMMDKKGEYILEEFVPPISNRRDGGLTMDGTGMNFPLKVKFGGATQECDGKIYYMGIIDILQQFNVRKRMEANLRKIQGGKQGASCVHPDDYADRFVQFFDEYTTLPSSTSSSSEPTPSAHEEEEVVFG